jgi:DNA-binding MarR family transcriptional regulator
VRRVESAEDRRIRTVALTPSGKELIVPVFRRHAATMRGPFWEMTADELRELEVSLKKVGKRAVAVETRRGATSSIST